MEENYKNTNQARMQALQAENPFITAHQAVYTLLLEDITSCRLEPGSKITEQSCADLHGCSRTTVRKAFEMLIEEDWLERGEGHRVTIANLSRKGQMEIMEYRMALEPTAARLAARNRTRGELLAIEKFARQCDTLDIHVLYENDLKFHRAIFTASKNRYLIDAYGAIDLRISREKLYTAPDFERFSKECFQEHYAIYEAIRAGDEHAAHKLSFQHIKMMLDTNIE